MKVFASDLISPVFSAARSRIVLMDSSALCRFMHGYLSVCLRKVILFKSSVLESVFK